MAMNMDAVLRIAAKITGMEDLSSLQRGLVNVEGAAKKVQGSFKSVVSSATFQAGAVAAGALAAGLGFAARAAISFESSMADVRKVVSGLETETAFKEIQSEILELTKTIPIAAEGFADIYAAAGQSGIARADLKDFATLVAQVGIAFDMTAGEAGTALAQMKVALGLTIPEVRQLADQMNYVSNNSGATASNLVEFMSRAGAAGKLAGFAAEQTMALGAAMIQTGVPTEVAATSFQNMVRALSAGTMMTDRQVDALRQLGFTMTNAEQLEGQLTRALERESERRLAVARNETDQLRRELDRRYRDQMTALQDGSDDQMQALEQGLRDQSEARVKALRREQRDRMDAERERQRAGEQNDQRRMDEISDHYERLIEVEQRATDRRLQAERRAERDRLTVQRDTLEDRKRLELQGIDDRQSAVEAAEQERLQSDKASAKKYATELAQSQLDGFAERFQSGAVDTVLDVLRRISNLPAAKQTSVLRQLFGDEARGLAPLLANLKETERLLGLAADKGAAAGSVLNEFNVRSDTTANKLQLMNNQLRISQILVGSQVLQAFQSLDKVIGPVLNGFAKLAESQPVLARGIILVTSALAALVLLAPGIATVVTSLGLLGAWFQGTAIAATIAGWAPAIIGAFGTVLTWLTGTLVPGLLFIFGPAGLIFLAIAALVAVIVGVKFREPILKFLGWLGESVAKAMKALVEGAYTVLLKPWVDLFNVAMRLPITGMIDWLKATWNQAIAFIGNALRAMANAARAPFLAVVDTIRGAMNAVLRFITGGINAAVRAINVLINGYNQLPGVRRVDLISPIGVPQFAEGGVVDRPTLAMVGEGGEREYIIPESKMGAASAAYLAGTRGGAVLGTTTAAAVINITTGPVLQQDGQQWVTLRDLERAMRATEAGTLARIRTPAGRSALGIR